MTPSLFFLALAAIWLAPYVARPFAYLAAILCIVYAALLSVPV